MLTATCCTAARMGRAHRPSAGCLRAVEALSLGECRGRVPQSCACACVVQCPLADSSSDTPLLCLPPEPSLLHSHLLASPLTPPNSFPPLSSPAMPLLLPSSSSPIIPLFPLPLHPPSSGCTSCLASWQSAGPCCPLQSRPWLLAGARRSGRRRTGSSARRRRRGRRRGRCRR